MDGQAVEWMNGQMDGKMNEWMVRQINEWIGGMYEEVGWMAGYVHKNMDK